MPTDKEHRGKTEGKDIVLDGISTWLMHRRQSEANLACDPPRGQESKRLASECSMKA